MPLRKCPGCNNDVYQTSQYEINRANKKKTLCIKCSNKLKKRKKKYSDCDKWSRTCSECGKEVEYKTRDNYLDAEKNNRKCHRCACKIAAKFHDKHGDKNPFYNKHHTEETKENLSKQFKNKKLVISEAGKLARIQAQKNRKREPCHTVWTRKYGIEEADARLKNMKLKMSASHSGEKAYWYNKQLPVGVGCAWNGWYKDNHFRSLLELSYMVKVLDKQDKLWISAEKTSIKYEFEGKSRTYRADFILDNHFLIECKPLALQSWPMNQAKKEAAEKWCEENGMEYVFVDIPNISTEELIDLYLTHQVWFTRKSDTKIKELIKKKRK